MTAQPRIPITDVAPFVVVSNDPEVQPPDIVVQYDVDYGTGANWSELVDEKKFPLTDWLSDGAKLRDAVLFLREAIEKMTRRTLVVRSSAELSGGIVFTTLAGATSDIRKDPRVLKALANDGSDAYNANEAYYIRTEAGRIILVANTNDGLVNAAAELAESVGYHVLGMGPNWVDVPEHSDSLVFYAERSGRPGYYLRLQKPMSGQEHGWGLIAIQPLNDSDDEPMTTSFRRWRVGVRMSSQSMPEFPGHALQKFHQKVANEIRRTGKIAGFLQPTYFGTIEQLQNNPPDALGQIWVINGAPHEDGDARVFYSVQPDSNVKRYEWKEGDTGVFGEGGIPNAVLDLSVPKVRCIIFERVKADAEKAFGDDPDGIVMMELEPEDGGVADELFKKHTKDPNWYPDYLASEGLPPLGAPYALHDSYGLDQPNELWDPTSPTDPPTQSDTMYAFALWILREYDKHVDERVKAEEISPAEASKRKALVRASFYSYAYHDVPPQFNIREPRVLVMVAGSNKYLHHRGNGKWASFEKHLDVAAALQVWLPEPAADYRVVSNAYYADWGLAAIDVDVNFSAEAISDNLSEYYTGGVRAVTFESDFNFGKFGLFYYLTAKKLWNPAMTADELDAIRDQWLQRSFGSAWETMKRYYDFMLRSNYPLNSSYSWGHAVALITEADRQINPVTETAVKARIDDLKQFWYFYSLCASGTMNPAAPETKEFVWKGQMSYMNSMLAVIKRVYPQLSPSYDPAAAAGEIAAGPAHYEVGETDRWWGRVRETWPEIPVNRFEDATLADGTPANTIDLNDLTLVDEFVYPAPYGQLFYGPNAIWPGNFLTTATEPQQTIGFTLWWPHTSSPPMDVHYVLEWWNPEERSWETILQATKPSVPTGDHHLVHVETPAPKPGTFRFGLGPGGNQARLAPYPYEIGAPMPTSRSAHTYAGLTASYGNYRPLYFYIPKGTRSIDLSIRYEVPKVAGRVLRIYKELPPVNPDLPSQTVDISKVKTYQIPLAPGEDGTIASIHAPTEAGFEFPYLHSVPRLWAMSPAELLVPRAIAAADGLTPAT